MYGHKVTVETEHKPLATYIVLVISYVPLKNQITQHQRDYDGCSFDYVYRGMIYTLFII